MPATAPRPSVSALGRDLLALSLLASLATLAVTTVLFLFIPRIGQAALPLRTQAGRIVAGFTEKVELGAFGEIEADSSVVMRVHLKEWTRRRRARPRRCRRCAGAASPSISSTAGPGR